MFIPLVLTALASLVLQAATELMLAGSISARLFREGDGRERQELSAAVKATQKMILSARQALSPIPAREPRFFVLPTAIAEASSRFFIVDSEALAGFVPSRAQVRLGSF